MVNNVWKQEFSTSFLRVEHHKPHLFVTCLWQRKQEVHWAYVTYRWIMTALFLLVTICSILDLGRNEEQLVSPFPKWPIYLTNWGFLMCTVQFLIGAILVTKQCAMEEKHGKYVPVRKGLKSSYQVYWVFNTIALVLALGISICYWGTVYDPASDKVDLLNGFVHAGNVVGMFIDFFLVAHPFRLLHCYWTFLFTAIYVLFNLVYFELGGTERSGKIYIYPLMNWSRPRKTLLSIMFGLIFILVLHCIVWMIYMFKRWLSHLIMKDDSTSDDYHHSNRESIPMDIVV